MSFALHINVTGIKDITTRLNGLEHRIRRPQPAFEIMADLLEGHAGKIHETQGASINEPWPALAPSTIRARTARRGYYARSPSGASSSGPPMLWTGRGRKSFRRGGQDHIREITGSFLRWGSAWAPLVFHLSRRSRSRLPRRAMFGFANPSQRRDLLVEPLALWILGVPAGAIRATLTARLGL